MPITAGTEPERDPVDRGLDRQLVGLRLLDHPARSGRARCRRPPGSREKGEAAGSVHRAADQLRARRLLDRRQFAGDHRLVDPGTRPQTAAHRPGSLARPYPDQVADRELHDRDVALGPIADPVRDARLQRGQPGDRRAGLSPRPCLERPAEQDQVTMTAAASK